METINNLTDAKLLAIQSLLEHYEKDHLAILLTLSKFQLLYSQHVSEEDLPTNSDHYQIGANFFFDLVSAIVR